MIEVHWSNEMEHTLIWDFTKSWNWNDFYSAQKVAHGMIELVDGIVDSIFVTDLNQRLPPNATSHLRNLVANRHTRHNMIVIVGIHPFLIAMLRIVNMLIPGLHNQLHYVSTLDEAENYLSNVRAKRQVAVIEG